MDILSIENVVKQYKSHLAVDNVSFKMKKGTVFGVIFTSLDVPKTILTQLLLTIHCL